MPEQRNIDHDYEVLRDFATRVARSATSSNHIELVTGLYLTGVLGQRPATNIDGVSQPQAIASTLRNWVKALTEKAPPGVVRDSVAALVAVLRRLRGGGHAPIQRDVGIWRRESDSADAAFVRRRDRRAEWGNWAAVPRIGAKRGKWRVVLIGESVARGYFYDPAFNPALVLQAMLRAFAPAQIDVVDLARTNLGFEELKALIRQSVALQPDFIVVFAGNNWRPRIAEQDIPLSASLLLKHGVPGMKSRLDAQASAQVESLVSSANNFLAGRDISAIWLVPEFNLVDWTDPPSPAPLLPGGRNEAWAQSSEKANLALVEGALQRAETAAMEMFDLDGGTTPTALRILAECCLARDDRPQARRYLELCRDARGWDPSFAFSPRTSVAIQNALRRSAPGPRSMVVDLPEIFDRHLGGALPDRRLFLDYCHLTAEGISVAMSAVASKILQRLTGRIVAPDALRAAAQAPESNVEGRAAFLAAVHNAHYFQSSDIVLYWCKRALQAWPQCADVMRSFADFQTRGVPNIACRSGMNVLEQGDWSFLLSTKRVDILLADVIAQSVSAAGADIAGEISALRLQEHRVRNKARELTDFYYSSTVAGPDERAFTSQSFASNYGSRAIYAAAFWQQSRFVFFADSGDRVGLKICYRVPGAIEGDIELAVNGHYLTKAAASSSWKTLQLSIPAEVIKSGMNEIVVTWPNGRFSADEWLGAAVDSLLAGFLPRFYRVFGEISTLLAYGDSEVAPGGAYAASNPQLAPVQVSGSID